MGSTSGGEGGNGVRCRCAVLHCAALCALHWLEIAVGTTKLPLYCFQVGLKRPFTCTLNAVPCTPAACSPMVSRRQSAFRWHLSIFVPCRSSTSRQPLLSCRRCLHARMYMHVHVRVPVQANRSYDPLPIHLLTDQTAPLPCCPAAQATWRSRQCSALRALKTWMHTRLGSVSPTASSGCQALQKGNLGPCCLPRCLPLGQAAAGECMDITVRPPACTAPPLHRI